MPKVELTDEEFRTLQFTREISSVSRATIAKCLSITTRTVSDWVNQGMPRNVDGTYDVRECLQWHLERARSRKYVG